MAEQQPAPPAAPEPEPEPAPPRRGLWRVPRTILARYLQFLARHRFMGCLAGLIVLVSLCGVTSWAAALLAPGEEQLAELFQADTNDPGTLILANEAGVEQYVAGMTEFDAARMWDAYSAAARTEMVARGRTVDELQRGLDEARTRGARIEGSRALGSYPLRDGRRFVFYVVRRSGFPPNGGSEELYFVFTVEPSGKILEIV